MIRWAKENGFHYYDFCEIDFEVAEAFLSSDPIPENIKASYFYGPTMFKLQFGGHIVSYPDSYVFYSDKMKHLKETSGEELTSLLKLSRDFYWSAKRFFRKNNMGLSFNHM